MKIGLGLENSPAAFKGFWNNKTVLKGLEFVSEHGSSFTAGVSFVMASGVRPLAISLAPDVNKENKKYAQADSIVSGITKFIITAAAVLPIEKAVKLIEKNPDKFLNKKTIYTFKNGTDSLSKSPNFKFAAQVLKLGAGFIAAVPKSLLSAAIIPAFAAKFLNAEKKQNDKTYKTGSNTDNKIYNKYNPVFSPSFKGAVSNAAAKGIGKLLDIETVQNAASKFSSKNTDIARNITIGTDLLLTGSFAYGIMKNKKIEKERKKPLILNKFYSSLFSITAGFAADEAVKKNTKNFIDKFKEINKNDPKLPKYIEGINIIRPVMIYAGIYYCILPVLSTCLADKTSGIAEQKQ